MTPNLEVPKSRKSAAAWTDETAPASAADKPKRLSLEFPPDVHHRTKVGAYERGNTMLGEILELVRGRNGMAAWPEDVVASVLAQVVARVRDGGAPWPAEVVDSVLAQVQAQAEAGKAAARPSRARRTPKGA